MIATIGLGLALMCDPAVGTGLDRRATIGEFLRATAAADADALDGLLHDGASLRSADGSVALPKDILLSAARSETPQDFGDVELHSWIDVENRTAVVADYGEGGSQLLVFGFFETCIDTVTVFT